MYCSVGDCWMKRRAVAPSRHGYVFLPGEDDFLSYMQYGMFKGKIRAVFVDKREYGGPLDKMKKGYSKIRNRACPCILLYEFD